MLYFYDLLFFLIKNTLINIRSQNNINIFNILKLKKKIQPKDQLEIFK